MRFGRRHWKSKLHLLLICFVLYVCYTNVKWINVARDLTDRGVNVWDIRNLTVNGDLGLTELQIQTLTVKTPVPKKCFQLTWNRDLLNQPLDKTCAFITIASKEGRLGNHMFRVASLIGMAYTLDLVPILPNLPVVSKWFELPNMAKLILQNSSTVVAPDCCRYLNTSTELDPKYNWTVHGYLQSWKYFFKARSEISEAFRFRADSLLTVKKYTDNLRINVSTLVGVHVRRRDMASLSSGRKGYIAPGADYISKAMQHFRDLKLGVIQFIIISDDMTWCKVNVVGENITYSPFKNSGFDMALMTSCDHVIITSGSYGWWGGWLAGGRVVYFSGFPKPDSALMKETDIHDYYPPEWLGL